MKISIVLEKLGKNMKHERKLIIERVKPINMIERIKLNGIEWY